MDFLHQVLVAKTWHVVASATFTRQQGNNNNRINSNNINNSIFFLIITMAEYYNTYRTIVLCLTNSE